MHRTFAAARATIILHAHKSAPLSANHNKQTDRRREQKQGKMQITHLLVLGVAPLQNLVEVENILLCRSDLESEQVCFNTIYSTLVPKLFLESQFPVFALSMTILLLIYIFSQSALKLFFSSSFKYYWSYSLSSSSYHHLSI